MAQPVRSASMISIRGLHRFGRWRNVGVEVLHSEDVRIAARGRSDAIDVETWYRLQAPDAHRTLLVSIGGA
jgi:hypothetical protein